MTTTLLSHTSTQLVTVDPLFPGDYAQGLSLCRWTHNGRTMFSLDDSELCGVLRVLPTDMFVAVLGGRGVLCTVGALDDDELRAILRKLSTDMLIAILDERGILCTMGGETPDVAAGLDALAAERHAEKMWAPMAGDPMEHLARDLDDMPQSGDGESRCIHCGQPETAHDPLRGGLLCRRAHGGNGETFTRSTRA